MWIPSKKVNHAFKPNILYLFWRLKLSFVYEPVKKNKKKIMYNWILPDLNLNHKS
jgi:hypothetical protein